MAIPQPTDQHIRIASSIQEEIMMRDFTKRQRSILDFILRLSWGCGKKTAIVPRQKDFSLVGIDETKINAELQWLVNAKVITWNRNSGEFAFIKDYEQWKVSIVPGYNKERFAEILHMNLLAISASGELDEKASILYEKARNNLPKKQVGQTANTDKDGISGQSITSIITSKDIYTADFELFYSKYPRSEDKRRTFKNWKTCLKSYSSDDLLNACNNYKKAKAGTDKQYIKSSANFLGRDKPFEDYINYEPEEQQSTRGWE